jgi:hypothetical protein
MKKTMNKSAEKNLARLLLLGALVLPGLPSAAAKDCPPEQTPAAQAQRDQLAERSEELERRIQRPVAGGARGPAIADLARRSRLHEQQREIEALIQRIEAGEEVAPSEVERLLEAR